MTLKDAINHCYEVADIKICNDEEKECGYEHLQLASWLERLEEIRDDLKYYLDTNEENGVVYIPKFIVERLIKDIK